MLKHTDPTKDPDWNKVKLAVMADKMKIAGGKGKNCKDSWYDKPNVWKHCHLKGCTIKKSSRFKDAYRKHCWKYHQEIDLELEQ